MGGCQNYGPFLGTLNMRCRIVIGIQKGPIILTTTRIEGYREPICRNVNHHSQEALGVDESQQGLGFRVYLDPKGM